MRKISIYIHIPFCVHKCAYCNFVSSCNLDKMDDYVSSLIQEIKIRGKEYGDLCNVATVYIGGGSPSVLKDGMIAKIMTEVKNNFKLLSNCEITVETNPGSVNEKKLLEYKLVGVNRLSIGGQSMNEKILKTLDRSHSVKDTKQAIKFAKKVGFENISVDMMLALPNQTVKDVKKMASFLIKQKIQHISSYALILEEHTPLYKAVKAKKVVLPSEDVSVEMYNLTYNMLKKHGYKRYEVSNFSLPDYESKHNLTYWQMGEYLAFGVAGHSFMGGYRFSNTEKLNEYISSLSEKKLPIESKEKTTLLQRKDETIMLALRTSEGINLKDFNSTFGGNLLLDKAKEIEFLTKHNFITVSKGYLKVNDNAFYVLNSIIAKLV